MALRTQARRPNLDDDRTLARGAAGRPAGRPGQRKDEDAMRRRHLTAFAIAATATASPVLAQTTPATPGATGSAAGRGGLAPGQVRAKALLDRDVYSSDGVEIGEVEDLILDAQGRVVTAVIEVESRLGFSEKYVAMPYDQLRPDNAQRRVNLPMTRDQLRALPGFRYED
jgi:sporulation protein YlmC with PRC-barrel domain